MSMSMAPKVPQPRQLPPLTGMPHLRTHRALMVLYSVYLLLSKVHFTDLINGQQYFTVFQIEQIQSNISKINQILMFTTFP